MGAYSTETITRSECLSRVMDCLETATDEQLGDALFALTQGDGPNYSGSNYAVTSTLKALRAISWGKELK